MEVVVGAAIFAVGSVGVAWAARRDLGKAERYPDRWNVSVQRRLVSLTSIGAAMVCIVAAVVVLWTLVQET